MTTLFGNIILGFAALSSGILITTISRYKAPHGGVGGVSAFPIWVLLIHVVLLIALGLVAVAIARKEDGFDWVAPNKILRFLVVAVGLSAAIFTSMMSALAMEREISAYPVIRQFTQYAYVIIPVILVIGGIILMNDALRQSLPGPLYRWPLTIVFIAGVIGAGAFIAEEIVLKNQSVAERQSKYEHAPAIQAAHIQEITNADIAQDLVRILEFTGTQYPQPVRDAAVAKVRSHLSLEDNLLQLMQDERALEVFNFISWNSVEDKSRFAQPIYDGIVNVAAWVRHTIQGTNPSDIHRGMFGDEINRVIRTVDMFQDQGIDYLPAIRELRAAHDEPLPGKKTSFDSAEVLDRWIQAR